MNERPMFLLVGEATDNYAQQGLREVLATLGALHLAPEDELVERLQEQYYDLVIVDAGATQISPEILVARARQTSPASKAVVITASPHWKIARAVYLAGAREYLDKTLRKEELLEKIKAVLASSCSESSL